MSTIKKIVITGPESSGKSTLSQQLAAHYDTQWVPEFARTYLNRLDRPYQQEDLLEIASGQAALEDQKILGASQYLFCDTGLEVIKIWSLFKYGSVDNRIEKLLAGCSYEYYLLCTPDLEWTPDPLRETPRLEDRWWLFELYEAEIRRRAIPWSVVKGQERERLETAIGAIGEFFFDI